MTRNHDRASKSRRKFLKALGVAGAAGLAGCGGDGDGDGDGGGDGGDGGDSGDGGDGGDGGGTATSTPTITPPDAETVLTFWTLFGGGDGVVFDAMINEFNNERPLGDEVAIHRQRVPWDSYYDTLYTSMVGGESPDMAIMHGSYMRAWSDVVTPFNDYIDFAIEDEYLTTFKDFVTVDGNINALPLDYHPVGIYYNKDIFEEAGLDPESPPSNYEEFKEAGDTIVSETDAHAWAPTPYNDGVGSYRAWSGFVRQAGGQLWEEGYSAPAFDNDVGNQMAEMWWDMTGDWGWAAQSGEGNWGNRVFQDGQLAMVTNGTWYVNVMRELEDFNWGFFKPFVAPDRQEKWAWADGHTVILPGTGGSEDRKQTAADAIHWITTQNPEWGAEAGHFPASREIHESGALEDADIYDKTLSKYLEMAEDQQYFFHPQVPKGNPNNNNWYNWLVDIWSHTTEPGPALQSGIDNINNSLE